MTLTIGKTLIGSPTALAPMEAVNCKAFRMLCKEMGCGLIYSPMVWADEFLERWNKEKQRAIDFYLDIDEKERPISVQIVGNDKIALQECAKIIENYADIIDLNLGCPEKDILGKKSGGFFMKHPEQMVKFKDLIKNSKVPVTAKIRLGWDCDESEKISDILLGYGISAIAIHGRTVKQGYTGKADWEPIKRIREKIAMKNLDGKILVIGNGDVTLPGHAKSYLERAYCDIVMVGRFAKRDPSIFSRINDALSNTNPKNYSKDFIKKRFSDLYRRQKIKRDGELKDHINWMN